MSELGARIRARRQALGLSQGRLAEAAQLTASAVSQIESGTIRSLKSETLHRIAQALQTTELELTAGLQNSAAALSGEEQRLLEMYRKLSPPLQEIALKLIKALN